MRISAVMSIVLALAGPAAGRSQSRGASSREGVGPFSPSVAFALPGLPLGAGYNAARRGPARAAGVELPRLGLMAQPSRQNLACRTGVHRMSMNAGATVSVEAAKSASFEEAQELGMALGLGLSSRVAQGSAPNQDEESALEALLSHPDGARGFYVTTLTAPELDNLFEQPILASVLSAIKSSPDPNVKLLTMNIAMSTATELAHLGNGNDTFARASAMTRDRTRALITALLPDFPPLKTDLAHLLTAAADATPSSSAESAEVESYRKFLERWGYNDEMRKAIAEQLRAVIA